MTCTSNSKNVLWIELKEIRKLAYDYAKEMCVDVPFNHETKMAGVHWLNGFYESL